MHPSSASPRPLREVFPILLLQAGLTFSGQLAGLEMPLDLGAHVLLHRERRGWGWLCPEPRAAVPSLSPCPHRTAWPSWASTGMRRSSSSSCESPDHRGTGIQLAAWGDREKVGSRAATELPGIGTHEFPPGALPGQGSPAWCGPGPPSWPGPCPGESGPSSRSPGSRHSLTGRGSAWGRDRAVGTPPRSHRGSPEGHHQHHHLISFFLGSSTSRSSLA